MQEDTKNEENKHKNKVHGILAHSYLFSFVSFLLGLLLDFVFPFPLFKFDTLSIGVILIALGSILALWAQKTSLNFKRENITKESFLNGPYKYTRSPTHYGIFILMLGFGVMMNYLFVIVFSIISFLITKFLFIKEQEKILALKYGSPYLEYKKSVKF